MPEQKANPTNKDVYLLLGEIKGMLNGLVDMQTKIMLALIGLAGATLGLKLVGSPTIQVVMFYIKAFIFLFTTLLAVSKRDTLRDWHFLAGYGLFAGLAELLKVTVGSELFLVTILFSIANVALLAFVWNWDRWRKE